jgi:flagellar assembly protein FliH
MSSSPEPRVIRRTDWQPMAFAPVDTLPLPGSDVEAEERNARVQAATDAGYHDGYNAGHALGRAEGERAGFQQAHAEKLAALTSTSQALVHAIDQLRSRDAVVLAEITDEVARLAFAVVEEMLGKELALAEEPVVDAVKRALRLAPDRGAVIVRAHPEDAAMLGQVETLMPGRSAEVVSDPSVELGGCILDVGSCTIDAQIGPALERVREVLAGSRPTRRRGPEAHEEHEADDAD